MKFDEMSAAWKLTQQKKAEKADRDKAVADTLRIIAARENVQTEPTKKEVEELMRLAGMVMLLSGEIDRDEILDLEIFSKEELAYANL